mgnify:CR=1 FL=1
MEIRRESSEEVVEAARVADPQPEPGIGWADALGEDVENPPTARVHGRQLIEPDGTVHTLATCENRIKGQFELWVQNNALRAIAQVESTGDLERADKLMSAYVGDWGAGHYSWDGRYVRRARFESLPGINQLIYLLMVRCNLKETEEGVVELVRKYPRQCGELLRWALGNSPSPAAKKAVGDNGIRTGTQNESGRDPQLAFLETLNLTTEEQELIRKNRKAMKPMTLD